MKAHTLVKEIIISEQQIQNRVKELAQSISLNYANNVQPIIMIGILRGCVNFLVDLMRNLSIDCVLDFMYVASFEGKMTAAQDPIIKVDIFNSITNRDVLIVEDIIDSGKTLLNIINYLQNKKPKSIKIVTLLDKKAKRTASIEADWIGFEVPDAFLIGYGLDYQELLRNLPYVAIADVEKIEKIESEKNHSH